MRWVIALAAELYAIYRWPIKAAAFLILLFLSAWTGIAGPVIEYYDLLGETYGLDDGRTLQGQP